MYSNPPKGETYDYLFTYWKSSTLAMTLRQLER